MVYFCSLKNLDMIKRRNLRTMSIRMLVLDEADEMLNKGLFHIIIIYLNYFVYYYYQFSNAIIIFSGFKEQIYDVYRHLAPGTQILLISATLPHEILEMTSKFMTDPVRIIVKR